MEENNKDFLESETKTGATEEKEAEAVQTGSESAELDALTAESEGVSSSEPDALTAESEGVSSSEPDADSTFAAESVQSQDALEELMDDGIDKAEDVIAEEMTISARYAADCESCATRVFFEKEDLNEEGNLICPNCQETIEIDNDAMDYYLVEKATPADKGAYVADCAACEAVVHFTEDDIDDDENIICPQCGEKIHIETEVLDAYKEKDVKKALKRKETLKKVGAALAGVVLALAVCFAVLWFGGNKSVLKIDGTSVPMNIYKCVYYLENAVNYRSSGLNFDEKPSSQAYEGEEYDTWDDLLKSATLDSLKIYYSIYNAGQKEGFELGEKEQEEIESTLKNVKTYADSSNLSFEDYIKTNYGVKLSEKDFREYLELSSYVNAYYKSVMAKDITDEQLEKIYKENPENYDVVTFRYFYVAIDDSLSEKEALKQVEEIAAAKTEKEFHELVKKYAPKDRKDTYKDDESSLVKDMACANIQDRPVAAFLTNPKSKKGESVSGVSEDGSFAEVAMLIEPKHKSEDMIRDAAITEVASKKGQKFVADLSKKATVKSSLGMILRNIEF